MSYYDELEKEEANKVSPAKNTYIRKRKKPIDVVSTIPINKSTALKEQIEKKKKKKKKETEEEPIHEAKKQVEEEIHEAAKQVVEEIHEAAMGRKTDKVCKEWEREQNMQIVMFEKISSDEPKKTTEANEGVFKSIEIEMRNSRKKSRAKKRNLPRMIAAKKSSTPQIPSNSEGRNNSEELDELESSFEPYTEREEEKCEEENEYISTEVRMEVEDPLSEVMETDDLESSFEPYIEREEEKCEEEDEYISTEVGMEVEDPSSEVMEQRDAFRDQSIEDASKINESEEETQGKGNEEKEDEAKKGEDYNKKREDEERRRDVETIPTTTPATGLVSIRNHSLFSSFLLTYLFLS